MGHKVEKYSIERYSTEKYKPEAYQSQLYSLEKYELLKYGIENKNAIKKVDSCDKYDYIAAVACGAIGGIIDIFLVGTPGDSPLGNWTDKQVDEAVKKFAKKMGWNPSRSKSDNVKSAIGFLEHGNGADSTDFKGFKVNYDQRKPSDVGNKFVIAPRTHHMMSLGHSPDIVGLFFSVLNQFTNTSSFIADGELISIDTQNFELRGGNFVAKLLCGIANWFGHLMSDVAGSSGAHTRGTGIVIPFYELFGFCKFGKFKTKEGIKDLAELTQYAYTHGYDARFGLTMAIPVVIADLSIRLIWSIRRYYQYGKPLRECLPFERKHDELRVMLIFAHGTLCMFDLIDAAVESRGCAIGFFVRLNLIAWVRLVALVFKEICIRYRMRDCEQLETPIYNHLYTELKDDDITDEDISKNQKIMDKLGKINVSEELKKVISLVI